MIGVRSFQRRLLGRKQMNRRTMPSGHEFTATSPALMPHIVCLCGSTKFHEAFTEANYRETMKGHIVLSVGFFMHAQNNMHGGSVGVNEEQKSRLDVLHLRKIDLADEVLVLNVIPTKGPLGEIAKEPPIGYIGRSTRREAWYARRRDKPVRFLNPITDPNNIYCYMGPDQLERYIDSWFSGWGEWNDAAEEASKI
jgi:hypothetical protein